MLHPEIRPWLTDPRRPVPKQHRCHTRLVDATTAIMSLRWGQAPERFGLWFKCVRSEVGEEPTEPHIIDPAKQAFRLKDPALMAASRDAAVARAEEIRAGRAPAPSAFPIISPAAQHPSFARDNGLPSAPAPAAAAAAAPPAASGKVA